MGWPLDVIESVCAAVVVGLACDYTMHVAVAITRAGGCLRTSLELIVPPMVVASLTTAAGGAALLPCTIIFFSRFGAFVVVTAIGSLAYSVLVLPAVLLVTGMATLDKPSNHSVARDDNDGTSRCDAVESRCGQEGLGRGHGQNSETAGKETCRHDPFGTQLCERFE